MLRTITTTLAGIVTFCGCAVIDFPTFACACVTTAVVTVVSCALNLINMEH